MLAQVHGWNPPCQSIACGVH